MGVLFEAKCSACQQKHDFYFPDADSVDGQYVGTCPINGVTVHVSSTDWHKVVYSRPGDAVVVKQSAQS